MISKNVDPHIDYNGDNVTLDYSIPFPTFEDESLDIYVLLLLDNTKTVLVKDVDYTLKDVNVNGVDASITLIDSGQAWINGAGGLDVQYSVNIDFDPNAFQPNSFRSLGNYSPISIENSLDRLSMAIKAVNYQVSLLDDTQTDINTQDIADIKAQLIILEAGVSILAQRITDLETSVYSKKQVITDGGAGVALADATINNANNEHMMFEYVIVRNGQVQYGRELIVGPVTFIDAPIERSGDVGVTFTVTNSAGVGTVRYNAALTGNDGEIKYQLHKYRV